MRGDVFRGRQIGDHPLYAEREKLGALHAHEAAVPVGQPLRRDGGERRQDRHHQGGSDQRLDQGKARGSRVVSIAAFHCPVLRVSRTVWICSTGPSGARTVITTVCGINGLGRRGSTKLAWNGSTSMRQRWPAISPEMPSAGRWSRSGKAASTARAVSASERC